MKTYTRFGGAFLLGLTLLGISNVAWSLGLGDARVESFLDQSLELKIELITQETDDLNTISVSLASADDYELIGASRDDISVPLQFSIQGTQGASSILVTSDLPIQDPVVRLIIEVNWASGRMLREYTLFLDPPTTSQPAPGVQTAAPPPSEQKPAMPERDSGSADETPEAPVRPASSAQATVSPPVEGEYGPVQSGETLWRIATDWSAGRDLNINKVMLAIQRKNPGAFGRNNINLLKRGAILRMPDTSEINAFSSSMAVSEVLDQTAALNAAQDVRRSDTPLLIDENAAPLPDEVAQPEEPMEEPAVSEPISEPIPESVPEMSEPEQELEQQAAEMPAEPQLELVPPSQAAASDSAYGLEETLEQTEGSDSIEGLRETLARKEEELINEQQQNSYLEQRLRELESQLAERDQSATVDDADLANMEQRLREERLAGGEDTPAVTPAETSESAVPKVVTEPDKPAPWYRGFLPWIIGLLVLVGLIVGWIMSRRDGSEEIAAAAVASEESTLRNIKDEAEDVLRVLDTETADEPVDEEDETVVVPVTPAAGETGKTESKDKTDEDEAELLDEESADPEIQLDLARAYISMGDKEAARVILEEVMANGSQKQQSEAAKMMGFL